MCARVYAGKDGSNYRGRPRQLLLVARDVHLRGPPAQSFLTDLKTNVVVRVTAVILLWSSPQFHMFLNESSAMVLRPTST
jgi:hypothetical protein